MADTITRGLDEDKVSEDAKYDGYFCLITSEIDYDYKKILEVYGSLWKIEESFRITKNELETRPIYLSTESHINGHFIICFVALLVIRMLQYKMNFSMSIERIVRALNTSTVSYTHLRAHETVLDLVCRLLLEKKKEKRKTR